MVYYADRLAEASVCYSYRIPMLRPRPVQPPLESAGGIGNLYILDHFFPFQAMNLKVNRDLSMTCGKCQHNLRKTGLSWRQKLQ
jgi:hypothetical protein